MVRHPGGVAEGNKKQQLGHIKKIDNKKQPCSRFYDYTKRCGFFHGALQNVLQAIFFINIYSAFSGIIRPKMAAFSAYT
jgi:hypothetical protein